MVLAPLAGISDNVSRLLAHEQGAAFQFLGFEGKPAGYFIMFCFCGLAYLLAWILMKALVPHYKLVKIDE